ncbi:MAG: NAD(P)/FAD-dependent oxidoreductase [Planctomycetaceae bacterium]
MMDRRVDVTVLGSGFAGTLAAAILARQGRTVCLLERGRHPRFAIGESSTPLADFKLHELATTHDLPFLASLCRYGTWMANCPQAMRGVKRGFAYFSHREGVPFETDEHHTNELLVAANSSVEHADTHWLRSDVDAVFVEQAIAAGVDYIDETTIVASESAAGMQLRCDRGGRSFNIETRFLIVASGNPQLWRHAISIPASGAVPRTNTRCVFAHFADVQPWRELMEELGFATVDHPFDCDQSALHHVFEGGWMWQLRFDDQTVSAGFLIDNHRHPKVADLSAHAQWQSWLDRFPSIAKQFSRAVIVRPEAGLQQVDHLQQPLRQIAGANWALLPSAVGFSDPLFSTGIGHSLFSVERLVAALADLEHPIRLTQSLATYSQRVFQEIDLIDRLVSLAYRSSSSFDRYITAAMPYFAAATTCEHAARQSGDRNGPAFLLADDQDFLDAVRTIEASHDARAVLASPAADSEFESDVRQALRPFNRVGLLTPESSVDRRSPRMYRYTAAR